MKSNRKVITTICLTSLILLNSPAFAIPADDVECVSCVNTTDLAPLAVTAGKIAPNAITSARVRDGEIKTQDIAPLAITAGKIAENAVTSARIRDGQVKTQDIADQGITESKLEPSLVNKINNPSVPTNSVPNGSMLYWDDVSESYIAGAKPTYTANNGQPVNNLQPYGTINYIIALQGTFPSRNSISDPTIGEITMFGGNFAPRNWAFCDGQLLSIASYSALFSILGTIYGGDGRTTFALPDLRGRVPIHEGTGPGLTPKNLGGRGGGESNFISIQ